MVVLVPPLVVAASRRPAEGSRSQARPYTRAVPRRSSKAPFEEFIDAFAGLPARVGCLAALGFVVLGSVVTRLVAGGSFWQLALWIVAGAVLLSTVAGAARRSADRRRFDATNDLDMLSWREFEGYLAEYFRRRGARVSYRGGAAGDGGVDLVVEDAAGRRIVQAKHWKIRRIGVGPLREIWGVREDERADGAIVVTSGSFTPEALRFAEGKRLELISGDALRVLIAEIRGAPIVARASNPVGDGPCPLCRQGTLVRRRARRGPLAGSMFLGCDRFPACRFTRDLPT